MLMLPLALLALFVQGQPFGVVELAITVVIVLAVCGLVMIFCRVTGLNPPQWLWQVIAIVVAAVVVIYAIKFVASM